MTLNLVIISYVYAIIDMATILPLIQRGKLSAVFGHTTVVAKNLGKQMNKFKYNIIKESQVEAYEEFPKHFLADTLEEAEELYKEYHSLLNLISYNYSLASNIDKGDLFGEALVGLARAKRDYEDGRGAKFKTFALYKIKTALNEHVRKNSMSITVPDYIRNANRHLEALKSIFKFCNINEDVLQESFKKNEFKLFYDTKSGKGFGKLEKKAKILFKNIAKAAVRANIATEELIKRAEFVPADIPYEECLDASDVIEAEEDRLFMALLVESVKQYMTATQLTIAEYIMDGKKTYREIGEEFGHSDAWVRQELDKLKEVLKKKGIGL